MSKIIEDILARLSKMEDPESKPPPPQETLTEDSNTLRGDENILLEGKSTLLPKETTSPNPGHRGASDQELLLEEASKKMMTLTNLTDIMKAQEENSQPAIF